MPAVTDSVLFWTMLATESKKSWTPESSAFSMSHPQNHTTQSLILIENQASLLWTHPRIDNVSTWTFPETGTLVSWIVPLPQAAISLPQPQSGISKYWFKTKMERVRTWAHPEYQIVSTLAQFGADRFEPLAQHETPAVILWNQSETGFIQLWESV